MIRTIFNLIYDVAAIIVGFISLSGIFVLDQSGVRDWVYKKLHAKQWLALCENDVWEDRRIESYKSICCICVWWTIFGISNPLVDTIMYIGAFGLPIVALIRSVRLGKQIHFNEIFDGDMLHPVYRMLSLVGCVYPVKYLLFIKFQWLYVKYILGLLAVFFLLYLLKKGEEKFKIVSLFLYTVVVCIYSFAAVLVVNCKCGRFEVNRTHTVAQKITDSKITGTVEIPKEDAIHGNYRFDVCHMDALEHKAGEKVIISVYKGCLGIRMYDVDFVEEENDN